MPEQKNRYHHTTLYTNWQIYKHYIEKKSETINYCYLVKPYKNNIHYRILKSTHKNITPWVTKNPTEITNRTQSIDQTFNQSINRDILEKYLVSGSAAISNIPRARAVKRRKAASSAPRAAKLEVNRSLGRSALIHEEVVGALEVGSVQAGFRGAPGDFGQRPQHALQRGEDLPEQRPLVPLELDAVLGEALERSRTVRAQLVQVRSQVAAPHHEQDL